MFLEEGIDQIHQELYTDALNTFKQLIEFYPNHPAGYFFIAMVYQTIMRNYRINLYEHEYEQYLNKAINTLLKKFHLKTTQKTQKVRREHRK